MLPLTLKLGIAILFSGFILSGKVSAQSNELKFNILKKEKKIGFLKINKSESSRYTDYLVSTMVEVSFIKKFRIEAFEKYRYLDDKLIYSELNRTINDNKKSPKVLEYQENSYLVKNGDKAVIIRETKINTNLVKLYFSEPLQINKVYCDNQQVMVNLEKINSNRYRIDFPNGVSNIFYYQEGKCVQVDVKGSFFHVRLIRE